MTMNLSVGNNTMRDEALSALMALGFQRIAVQKVLNKILLEKAAASVEDLIKTAIRQLT
jgi:Holliday junction DNA helicase RuvA